MVSAETTRALFTWRPKRSRFSNWTLCDRYVYCWILASVCYTRGFFKNSRGHSQVGLVGQLVQLTQGNQWGPGGKDKVFRFNQFK